jgi:ubiquinone biosynthesis protein COQ4
VAGLAKFLKNPDSLESVFAVAGSFKDSPLGEQMVEGSWRPLAIDLDAPKTLPAGSLGRCYADQLRR